MIDMIADTFFSSLEALHRVRNTARILPLRVNNALLENQLLNKRLYAANSVKPSPLKYGNEQYDISRARALAHEKHHARIAAIQAAMRSIENWETMAIRDLAKMLGVPKSNVARYRMSLLAA